MTSLHYDIIYIIIYCVADLDILSGIMMIQTLGRASQGSVEGFKSRGQGFIEKYY